MATHMTQRQQFVSISELNLVGYEGEVVAAMCGPEGQHWLTELPSTLKHIENDQLLYKQRNHVYRIADPLGGTDFCVKAFRSPDTARSAVYRHSGSKAQRAHQYARHLYQHHAAVAEPIGYFERWEGLKLKESYLISRFLDNSTDLYTEMTYLLRERPYAGDFVQLLAFTAKAVRVMHDSGFLHGDLGPQNILMTRTGPAKWANPLFIDLNRGRLQPNPSMRQRARDMERLKIPTHFLQIFRHCYFDHGAIPSTFERWAERYRRRFYWHQRSRKWRHPIDSVKQWLVPTNEEKKQVSTGQPKPRDCWLWDEYSAQPSVMLKSRERKLERTNRDVWTTLLSSLKNAPIIVREYRKAKANAYTQPVAMQHRLGISVEVDEHFDQQRQLLRSTANASVLVRCYFHLGSEHIQACEQAVMALTEDSHQVSLALIQSRQAVLYPKQWEQFADNVLQRLHRYLYCVEIGHAVNRVKWGLWNLQEISLLWQASTRWRKQYPDIIFLGPAVNDFEFQFYPVLLEKHGAAFDALSGHLYVDRRGAPENKQGPFSTLEKSVLAKAIANRFGKQGYYITEVNWPLQNTGLHSPVAGAYRPKHYRENALHVSEQDSAAYMIRYALITLCSGAAERLWWWRLAHPGFGLIDNADDGWRARAGWYAWSFFTQTLGSDTFREKADYDGVVWWHFDRCTLVYAVEPKVVSMPAGYHSAYTITGEAIAIDQPTLCVSGDVIYLMR